MNVWAGDVVMPTLGEAAFKHLEVIFLGLLNKGLGDSRALGFGTYGPRASEHWLGMSLGHTK